MTETQIEEMSFEDAVKITMLSFDSTLKANLSVGLPLDLHVYKAGTYTAGIRRRIEHNDPYFEALSSGWGQALWEAAQSLPAYRLDDEN